ncbi:response regulator [Terribacillus halophilus]|uniref:response regulator n=1 Tax=Terribacillus halophilus TaxID=361279 RepID=UPI000984E28B|nr:response regulator [Terribacillus halophilus]
MHERLEEMIRILIVDNNGVLGQGIQEILNGEIDMEVVGISNYVDEIVQLITEKNPQVMLVDTNKLSLHAFTTIEYIKYRFPDIKIVFMLPEINRNILLKGWQLGTSSFLLYESDPAYFIDSIRNIFREELVLSGKLARFLLDEVYRDERNNGIFGYTNHLEDVIN